MLRLLSGIFLSITIAVLFGSFSMAESASPDLESQFLQNPMWTGSDGAYSVDIGNGKALWLFSDTFIGTISGGKRDKYELINNSIGVQDINAGKMSFFWNNGAKTDSYFVGGKGYWLWLGDGVFYKNKVYCFAKRISSIPGMEGEPFGFVWKQDELIVIDNPADDPTSWKYRELPLPFSTKTFHFGTACLIDGEMLYVMGLHDKTKKMLLSRIPLTELQNLNTKAFEFLQDDGKQNEKRWGNSVSKCTPLFDHAAAEASLSKVGSKFVCIYHTDGLGAKIIARTSQSIAGLWSPEKLVYTVPDALCKRGNCYAAKGHPEQLCHDSGSMVVTFLINPGKLEAHAKDPYAYFPHVIEIKVPD